jgi:putative membrane protein
MARNVRRNILAESPEKLSGLAHHPEGRAYNRTTNADEWIGESDRWKKTQPTSSRLSEWANDFTDTVTEKVKDSAQAVTGSSDDSGAQSSSRFGAVASAASNAASSAASNLKDRWRNWKESSAPKSSGRGEDWGDVSASEYDSGDGRPRDVGKSLLIGLAGGLAATFIMTQVQTAWGKAQKGDQDSPNAEDRQRQVSEQSTVKVADRISRATTDHELPQEQKQTAGNAVHYGFGTLMGGVYGTLSCLLDEAPFGTGILFGMGLWLAADEFVLPYLNLSKRPQEKDLKEHLYEASMHAVYGLTLDAVNQLRRKVV